MNLAKVVTIPPNNAIDPANMIGARNGSVLGPSSRSFPQTGFPPTAPPATIRNATPWRRLSRRYTKGQVGNREGSDELRRGEMGTCPISLISSEIDMREGDTSEMKPPDRKPYIAANLDTNRVRRWKRDAGKGGQEMTKLTVTIPAAVSQTYCNEPGSSASTSPEDRM